MAKLLQPVPGKADIRQVCRPRGIRSRCLLAPGPRLGFVGTLLSCETSANSIAYGQWGPSLTRPSCVRSMLL